ncbi:MAG: hypothetical protein AVDCRST_MAG40-3050, partial [uncultured Gemmatimonadaceae bacterium]
PPHLPRVRRLRREVRDPGALPDRAHRPGRNALPHHGRGEEPAHAPRPREGRPADDVHGPAPADARRGAAADGGVRQIRPVHRGGVRRRGDVHVDSHPDRARLAVTLRPGAALASPTRGGDPAQGTAPAPLRGGGRDAAPGRPRRAGRADGDRPAELHGRPGERGAAVPRRTRLDRPHRLRREVGGRGEPVLGGGVHRDARRRRRARRPERL